MSDQVQDVEQLAQVLEALNQQYSDMESAYKLKMNQTLANSDIAKAKKELRKTRSACVAVSNERDALLDRIIDLERASRPDSALATRHGTDRDSRLKERLLPALNEPLLEVNPYSTSRHCGPEVAQKHNYLAAQQIAHYEQGLPKTEPSIQREVIKLPKSRSRPSKAATPLIGSGSGNVAVAAASSSNSSLPIEYSTSVLGMETDAQQVSYHGLAPAQRTVARRRGDGEAESAMD